MYSPKSCSQTFHNRPHLYSLKVLRFAFLGIARNNLSILEIKAENF